MLRSLIAATAALALFSAGLAVSANARGGRIPHIETKNKVASGQNQKNKKATTRDTDLTEFSSSSAPARKRSSPGR